MREQLYNDFMLRMSSLVDDETLKLTLEQLLIAMNDYEVTKRTTDIVPYEYMPSCVKTYLVTRKIEGVKQSSLNLYLLRLKDFFKSVRLPLNEITSDDIKLYLYNLQANSKGKYTEHMTNRTLDNVRTIISTFFKWASAEGYIEKNPCASIRAIKYNRKPSEYLSEEELELLRNACDNVRNRAILETFYSTGCRVSELVNMKIDDIDFNTWEIQVLGKGEKYRQTYINPKAKIFILKYLETRKDSNPYLFVSSHNKSPHALSANGVEKIIRQMGIKANLQRNVHPHLIRHTTASLSLQRGMDITEIQKMLGHVNISTTMIYAETNNANVKNSHIKYVI